MPKIPSLVVAAKFAAMRQWGEKAIAKNAEHMRLRPPYGTIGVGGADMAPFFDYLAIEEFLSQLRKHATPVQAATAVKNTVKAAIERWNNHTCKSRAAITLKSELHYWTGHCDTLIETMEHEFHRIIK